MNEQLDRSPKWAFEARAKPHGFAFWLLAWNSNQVECHLLSARTNKIREKVHQMLNTSTVWNVLHHPRNPGSRVFCPTNTMLSSAAFACLLAGTWPFQPAQQHRLVACMHNTVPTLEIQEWPTSVFNHSVLLLERSLLELQRRFLKTILLLERIACQHRMLQQQYPSKPPRTTNAGLSVRQMSCGSCSPPYEAGFEHLRLRCK